MSLLYDLINESAAAGATGAGSVANARGTLFGGAGVDDMKKTNMMRRIGWKIVDQTSGKKTNNMLRWRSIAEAAFEDDFDASDVISKLDAAEKKAAVEDNTVCFGMEDETGAIVKVYVRDDQAEDFEHALATLLGNADEDADDQSSHGEIAEVLYQLKDKFEIIDVDWGVIQGDEEEEQELNVDLEDGETDPDADADGEMDDMNDPGEGNTDPTEDAAKSALQDVIDIMKADSEAKKAEAEAEKAAAEAKIAEYATKAAEQKAVQSEEIFDMEAAEKAEKEAKKEAQKLAKLAAYRHKIRGNGDVANTGAAPGEDNEPSDDESIDTDFEENEEAEGDGVMDGEISKEVLADLIYRHLAANQT